MGGAPDSSVNTSGGQLLSLIGPRWRTSRPVDLVPQSQQIVLPAHVYLPGSLFGNRQ